jgi:hypothetical protein
MATTRDAQRDQQLPTAGRQPVQAALIRALAERRDYGIRKYGRPLETHNGRDALIDAWEEALDLLTYLTQMRLERGDRIGAAVPEPEPTDDLDITPWLVVHRYLRDDGRRMWSWRCWGDGQCTGWLALDLSNRAHAERNARQHLVQHHPEHATTEETSRG